MNQSHRVVKKSQGRNTSQTHGLKRNCWTKWVLADSNLCTVTNLVQKAVKLTEVCPCLLAAISLKWVPKSRQGDLNGEGADTRILTICPPQATTQALCTQLLVTFYTGTRQQKKKLLQKLKRIFRDGLSYSTSWKSKETAIPILSPTPLKKTYASQEF